MTTQPNTMFYNFGLKNFINILQNVILVMIEKLQGTTLKSFLDISSLEIEKAEEELKANYHFLVSADTQELVNYNFDVTAEHLENNSKKIKNLLDVISKKSNSTPEEKEFYEKLDSFYTTLVQCKIELYFLDAEVEHETNRAS